MTSRRFRGWSVLVVAVLLGALLPMAAGPAAAAAPTSKISWSGCYRELAAQFAVTYECSTVSSALRPAMICADGHSQPHKRSYLCELACANGAK